MTETFCTSGSVKLKAGANAPVLTADQYTELINQAESEINVLTRKDYSSVYSGLSGSYKKILEKTAAAHAALGVIAFNPSNYQSTEEAAFIANVNYTLFLDGIKLMKEQDAQKTVSGEFT